MDNVGFIILRHVNNEITDKYWKLCYKCIRNFYPENNILIIDDNSDSKFLTNEELYKTTIINSEFPKRGELLPYYYYLKNKMFDTAVILHDSVFINAKIDFTVDKYKMIWDFSHDWDQIANETQMIKLFDDSSLIDFHQNKHLWKGCFGAMTIINHDFLKQVNEKYDISKLLDVVLTRYNRCSFERVIACLLQKEHTQQSLLGDIHDYCDWGINFSETIMEDYKHLSIIKVWSSR